MSRYDYHLWTFCYYDFEEIAVRKLSTKLDIDYESLRNWWVAKRPDRVKRPQLPPNAYEKVLAWATSRGYNPSVQYDPIV